MEKIHFGTSGFRGIVADTLTKTSIQKIAYAVCKKIKELKLNDIIVPVGYDNRFMGKEFAKWLIEVFAFENIKTLFFEQPTPSPLIAFETKQREFGIHITASHNTYLYNGIKIFLKYGRETPEDFNKYFEKIANSIKDVKWLDYEIGIEKGLIKVTDNIEKYCDSLLSLVDVKRIKKRQPKILFNAMHGSSVDCFKYIVKKIGLKNFQIVKEEIDPYFEKKVTAPYVTNIQDQIKIMKTTNYDLGVALDGDGDRFTAISSNGEAFDCNYLSVVLIKYLNECGYVKGDIVKNCALSQLIDIYADKNNFKVINAKVGFKNIAKEMLNNDNAILGIESNGMSLRKHIMQKDGLLLTVLFMDIISKTTNSLCEIVDNLKKELNYPSEVVEYAYPINEEKKEKINNLIFKDKKLPNLALKITKTSYDDGLKMYFEKNYWAVIRFSGNENVVRIFAEFPTKKMCNKIVKELEKFIDVNLKQ